MPCRDYEPPSGFVTNESGSKREKLELKKRCDKLTALLCTAAARLTELCDESESLEPVYLWYAEHRKADVKHLEQLFKSTDLTKLSKADFDTIDEILSRGRL